MISVEDALDKIRIELERNEERKKEQAEKGFDGLTFFIYRTLLDVGVKNTEDISRKIKEAFIEYPDWLSSDTAMRELRQEITFAIYSALEDADKVALIVDNLFTGRKENIPAKAILFNSLKLLEFFALEINLSTIS